MKPNVRQEVDKLFSIPANDEEAFNNQLNHIEKTFTNDSDREYVFSHMKQYLLLALYCENLVF